MQDQLKTVKWFNAVSITIFIILMALTGILYHTGTITWIVAIAGAIISLFAASTIQIADQWEKAVVLRLGKFTGLKGPGIFLSSLLLTGSTLLLTKG